MGLHVLLWSLLAILPAQTPEESGVISGIAVNGSRSQTPLPGAEVVLRAQYNGEFVPVADAVADGEGRFSFSGLPTDGEMVFLPGVNCQGVHFPGPRIRLGASRPLVQVKLVAYDAISAPSPLVCRHHAIQVRAVSGALEVTESLVIDNPSQFTYIGESDGEHPPITFRISPPAGFETVTFEKEIHGRQFEVNNNRLATDMPWPPGKREMKFTYRLPIEASDAALARTLDLPADHLSVRTVNETGQVACNLPTAQAGQEGETVFESQGGPLPAGYTVELRFGALPLRFENYARWLALALLGGLVFATAAFQWARRGRSARTRIPQRRVDPPPRSRKRNPQPPQRRSKKAA